MSTCLVVDDDAAARRMMRRALERKGYAVEEASNGRQGLDRARQLVPDVVLLDLRMPGELSGVDVAGQLKGDNATRAIPIVIVSASAHFDARAMTSRVGCDAFIEKPVSFDELYAELDRLLTAG